MKTNLLVLCVLAAAAVSGPAIAQTAVAPTDKGTDAAGPVPAAGVEPDYTLAFNVGAITQYRYRGIAQTRFDPAVQGGIDFTHKSGIYLGAWASNIRWIKDAGGHARAELDFYGGYKNTFLNDFGYDVGFLRYQYPDSRLPVNPNTNEVYAALTYSVATLKYSHSTTNLFGFDDSKNSGYLDLSATFDLGNGFSLVPHIGRQRVNNNGFYSYDDYALTVGKDFGNGISAQLAVLGTNAHHSAYVSPHGKFLGKTQVVAGVKYAF